MIKNRIIIDTDPGVDDAFAIYFALAHPEIEVLGITTIFGNHYLEQTTSNALRLLKQYGSTVPVYQGSAQPLVTDLAGIADFVHGNDGLGDVEQDLVLDLAQNDAASFIVNTIRNNPPHTVSICALGPLTNLATALSMAPDIAVRVKQVIIMGGAINVPGNVNPAAEANVFSDAYAADKVLTAPWPIRLVPLDVTLKLCISDHLLQQLKTSASHNGVFLYKISQFYRDFYNKIYGIDGFFAHDPTVMVNLLHPEWFSMQEGAVRVATTGIASGMTIFAHPRNYANDNAWSKQPNIAACVDCEAEKIMRYFAEIFGDL